MWAYAQEGIALPHYTGSLWNSGMHVARSDLEPGDLVFFFSDISHVGIYIGDGMMIDAPDFGEYGTGRAGLLERLRRRRPDRLSPQSPESPKTPRIPKIPNPQRITEGHLRPGEAAWPAFLS